MLKNCNVKILHNNSKRKLAATLHHSMYEQFISNTNKATKEVVGFKRCEQVEEMPEELEELCEKRRNPDVR